MLRICLFILSAILITGCGNKLVKDVDRLEVDISGEGLDVKKRTVRAWVEGIERDVSAATLVHRFEEEQYVQGLAISPDGKQLVFSMLERRDKDKEGGVPSGSDAGSRELRDTFATLRSLRTGSSGMTQISTGNWLDQLPSFGPDNTITFSSNRLRRTGSDIFRISAERVGGVSVIHQASEASSSSPSVAQDGTMAYEYLPLRSGKNTMPQIWALGGALTYPVQLREGSMPAVSPDGKDIAFIGDDGQLWVMPITGQNPTQITVTKIPEGKYDQKLSKVMPAWTPDGTHIVYGCADGKDGDDQPNYDIWMTPRSGGNSRQLTTNGSVDFFPVVSPDQKFIYFVSNRGFKEGIWRIPFPF